MAAGPVAAGPVGSRPDEPRLTRRLAGGRVRGVRDARELDLPALRAVVDAQPYPLVLATVSGAHLYGFPSVDSDVDLRGVHLLPLREVVGLRHGAGTLTWAGDADGVELDLVTHDLATFARLLLGRNGYVLEQLTSPLVVATSPAHEEMHALVPQLLTRHHVGHYLGFARTQRRLAERTGELKPLLYVVRVLLTGVHLMRSGEVEAHLPTLADLVPEAPAWVPDAVAAKAGAEHGSAADAVAGAAVLGESYDQLVSLLEEEALRTRLPDAATAEPALEDLLVRRRLGVLVEREPARVASTALRGTVGP